MTPPNPGAADRPDTKRHEYVISVPALQGLSFAVWLIDDYTQKAPLGEVRVRLKEENIKAVKNLSGYHTFSGLPGGTYTLSVDPELYFPEERVVDTSSYSGSKEPVIEILLRPRPLYPFPDRATLLRGMLAAENGFLEGVTVKATSKTVSKETSRRRSETASETESNAAPKATSKSGDREIRGIPDEKGEFVLYFREAVKGKTEVDIEIKGEGAEKILPAVVEEGHSTYVGVISIR